jgi:hypothetical protein
VHIVQFVVNFVVDFSGERLLHRIAYLDPEKQYGRRLKELSGLEPNLMLASFDQGSALMVGTFFLRVKEDFITQKGLQDVLIPVPET